MSGASLSVPALGALLLLACSATPPAPTGPVVPDTRLDTLEGDAIDLGGFRGQVVLLDFWATWCVPCVDALPAYAALRERHHGRGFEVVAVSVDESVLDARAFVDRTPLPYPIAHDADGRLAAQLGVAMLPSSFLIDREGRVRHGYTGFDPAELPALEVRLEALLNE